MQDPKQLFEDLAAATWQRLALSWELGVSQGEETITDLLLLEIARCGAPNVYVVKTTKAQEARSGLDWEWWMGDPASGWLRFAIQAKKIGESGRYDALKHEVSGRGGRKSLQHEVLKEYAAANRAVPLYCLFNSVNAGVSEEDHWHCSAPFAKKQLGCTLAPVSRIEAALEKWGCRNFDFIHKCQETFPWRCLLSSRCSALPSLLSASRSVLNSLPRRYSQLPAALRYARDMDEEISLIPSERSADRLPYDLLVNTGGYYSDNLRIYPRRILLIEQDLFELSSEIEEWTDAG